MTDTIRTLAQELVEAWDATADFDFNDFGHAAADIVDRARALLAQPELEGRSSDGGYEAGSMWAGHPILTFPAVPDGREPAFVATQPSDGEAAELSRWLAFEAENALAAGRYFPASMLTGASELLARWGRPTPQPVAVSERLPGPEDCTAQGLCRVFDDQLGLPSWTLIRVQGRSLAEGVYWLPANALPTPEATND